MYNASFSVVPSVVPSRVSLLDTSAGSDANIASRSVSLLNADGSVYAQSNWPVGQNTLSLDILSNDVSLNILMTVISSAPLASPSTYTYSLIYAFLRYQKNYVYYLTQLQTANPSKAQDQNYYGNKLKLLCEILSAENAIDIGESQFNAQQRIVAGNYLIQHPLNYF